MVACHGELGQFLLDPEIDEGVLHRELVAEPKAVVVETETDLHHGGLLLGGVVHAFHAAHRLFQRHQHLVVVVADVGFLAPNGFPSLVETVVFSVLQHKGMGQVVAPFKGETHHGGQHHGLVQTVEGVIGHAVAEFKQKFQLSVGAFQGGRFCHRMEGKEAGGDEKE